MRGSFGAPVPVASRKRAPKTAGSPKNPVDKGGGRINHRLTMSWRTSLATRLFRHDQPFMARRKLRYACWALLAGLLAAGLVAAIVVLAHNQRG